MKPVISVIITTYNRKPIIGEALQSVFIQNPKNYEVIVVDDGSTDGTVPYLKSLPWSVRVYEVRHKGIAASRNRGIRKAKGDFVAFLDSDDLWLPGILSAQLSFLQKHPRLPLVYADQYIEKTGDKLARRTRFASVSLSDKQKSKFDLPGFVQFVPIHISSVMMRKSIFKEVGYFEERLSIHDDTEMWNRISEHHSLGYIATPYSIRRCDRDPERMTHDSHRMLYCSDGRRYLEIYKERRIRTLSHKENVAIQKSYQTIDRIEYSNVPLHFHLREFE